jgi:sugar transferase (PEP-CTERM system associated)
MISVLNRYVPARVFILVAAENALIAASISGVAWLHLWQSQDYGSFDASALQAGAAIALVCQITFYYFDLYDLRSVATKRSLIGRLLGACGTCCVALAVSAAIVPWLRMRAGIMEVAFVCLVLLILLGRLSLEWINLRMTAGESILIVGCGEIAASIAYEIQGRSDLNLRLLGSVAESDCDKAIPGTKQLGTIKQLSTILKDCHPDRVVLALRDRHCPMPTDLLLHYRSKGVHIEEAATLFEKLTGRIPVETMPPRTLLFSEGFSKNNSLDRVLARNFAVLLSVLGLIGCLPLMLLTAVLIRIESKGPILFRQERVGRDGVIFNILKFRSMRVDAEVSTGPQWARINDPRITRVGSIIRKLRIDELPQLFNVLIGDMNLVGPRPERPFFVDMLKEKVAFYDLRHAIRPGLTGWAQVSFAYGASVDDVKQKLEYDLFYVKNASLALDLAIIVETVRTVLLGKGR